MRVLVTRVQPQAAHWVQLLSGRCEAVALPLTGACLALAGAAIDDAEIDALLRILAPDVQRQAVNHGGTRIQRNIRHERKLNRGGILGASGPAGQ